MRDGVFYVVWLRITRSVAKDVEDVEVRVVTGVGVEFAKVVEDILNPTASVLYRWRR